MKKENVERRILSETCGMFFRHGIKTITMDDIASCLGISKKTIYLYYRDKSDLVDAFTGEELKKQQKEIFAIRKGSSNSIEEMMKVMIFLGQFFKGVNPAVFYDLQKYHPMSWNAFKQFKEKVLISFVEENLKSGISQGLYRKELNTKILSRLRIEEIELAFNPSIYPPSKFTITQVQLTLIDHFLHGIVTLKGFKLIDKYKKSDFRKHP